MTKKPAPLSVRAIIIIHSALLVIFILFLINTWLELISIPDSQKILKSLVGPPFGVIKIMFLSWLIIMLISIYGFIRPGLYARHLTLAFYGFIILLQFYNLLNIFIKEDMAGWQQLLVLFNFLFLCFLILVFYLALRPEVYYYCQQSE
jgi:hypothetical protein